MSKKKIKKEVVKRKTSIYDPMGVYGRGLTENQRQGMTKRMKIENIRDPGKVLTKKDLEEYKKTLIYYRIPTIPTSSQEIKTVTITIPLEWTATNVTNEMIYNILEQQYGIIPSVFYCDSFSITKPVEDELWTPVLQPFIIVGDSEIQNETVYDSVTSVDSNSIVTFPSYWIDGTDINYFTIMYDGSMTWAGVKQKFRNVFGDFNMLPGNSTMIPYLLFPNDNYPEMHFGVRFVGAIISGFQLLVRIRVL